jgi:UDP-N-acetyl-D-glucosamine 4,6-dehydratase
MIALSGKDLKIEYVGLRAGEKLYEELLINDAD